MWGRIKLKVSRSRDSATATTNDEEQDCVGDDEALSGLNKLSLSNSSDFVCNSHHNSRNADQTEDVADEAMCPSSMLHGLSSNHSSELLKNKLQINGNHFEDSCITSLTSMLPAFGCKTAASEQERMVNSSGGFLQNDNGININCLNFEKYYENYDGYADNDSCKVESDGRQVVEEMPENNDECCLRTCSSPPKLMRREKVKTGEAAELRKSRLSCHLKNNSEAMTSLPKPLELPPRMKSTSSLTPDDIQTDDVLFEARTSSTVVCQKPNVMSGGSSVSDGRMSTEPSTAESTDSGIQPSLCSGHEDRCMLSSGIEDDPKDDLFSEHFMSQNSDYMLLEDAKAMMASSLSDDGSCADYIDHFVVERCPNTHTQQVPVDYVPYCESVTVLRRVNRDPVDEEMARHTSCSSKVDYVPIDSSFAALYNGGRMIQNNTNAHITRCTETDDYECGRETNMPVKRYLSDCSSKPECDLNGSSSANMEYDQVGVSGRMQIQSQPVGFDIDSDDDSYLPPLPSRNYRNRSQRLGLEDLSILSDTVSSNASAETNNDEQTHMSWEEVMKEAHALGIPLSAPRSEVSDSKSSVSVSSSDMFDSVDSLALNNHSDCMSLSVHSAIASSCALHDKDVSNISQDNSPLKVSALAKCASPFKEKFRLHNLFSKKKSKKTLDIGSDGIKGSGRIIQRHSSAAAEIQGRNLPPLPPKRIHASSSNMSRSSLDPLPSSAEFSRPQAHRTLSTRTLPARENTSGLMTGSVWAGSSASVGCQSEMSASGISARSISSIESHRDALAQGNFKYAFIMCFICILMCNFLLYATSHLY